MELSKLLTNARVKGFAVGHFNIGNLEMLRAVAAASKECGSSGVMIGASEGERDFIGLKAAAALVLAYEEEYGIPLFLNADHSKSVQSCKAALDAGYHSVHFDGSALHFEENIRQTKEVVAYAETAKRKAATKLSSFGARTKSENERVNQSANRTGEISIEGELGYLGGGSQVTNERIVITPEQMTDPGQAGEYVKRTGVNRLAVAIGNVHGLNLEEPQLDFERLKAIREAVPESCALVLHAGSGIPDEDIARAISLGIVNIHVSTELRKAWRDALARSLADDANEYAPYKIIAPAVTAVKEAVTGKLMLFQRVRGMSV
jgi:fructose-bisphosphate aldolase class II